ncbi:MAG: DUF4352 domain-containing protein [Clostridiales bacterium]|nr:DUF4352 domain-containing protein [Clostridiales bacterium]
MKKNIVKGIILVTFIICFIMIFLYEKKYNLGEIVENDYYAVSVLNVYQVTDLEEFEHGKDIYAVEIIVFNKRNKPVMFETDNNFILVDDTDNEYAPDFIPPHNGLHYLIEPGGKMRGEVMFAVDKGSLPIVSKFAPDSDSDKYYAYDLKSDILNDYLTYKTDVSNENLTMNKYIETGLIGMRVINYDKTITDDESTNLLTVNLELTNLSGENQTIEAYHMFYVKDDKGYNRNYKYETLDERKIEIDKDSTQLMSFSYKVPQNVSSASLMFETNMYMNGLYVIDLY